MAPKKRQHQFVSELADAAISGHAGGVHQLSAEDIAIAHYGDDMSIGVGAVEEVRSLLKKVKWAIEQKGYRCELVSQAYFSQWVAAHRAGSGTRRGQVWDLDHARLCLPQGRRSSAGLVFYHEGALSNLVIDAVREVQGVRKAGGTKAHRLRIAKDVRAGRLPAEDAVAHLQQYEDDGRVEGSTVEGKTLLDLEH
jgi:hypothetical protein